MMIIREVSKKKFEGFLVIKQLAANNYYLCTGVEKFPDNMFRAHIIQCNIMAVERSRSGKETVKLNILYENNYNLRYTNSNIGVPYVVIGKDVCFLDGIRGANIL